MHFIFYRTNDVFAAEDLLQSEAIRTEIVPTPVQDKACCGVCVKVDSDDVEKCARLLAGMDYRMVE